jgi:hypothetical protein
MEDGKILINGAVDVLLGAGASIFQKALLGAGASKIGIQDVDTQNLLAGGLTFATGFAVRKMVPGVGGGLMGGATALTGMDILRKYNISPDFGLGKAALPAPSTPASSGVYRNSGYSYARR